MATEEMLTQSRGKFIFITHFKTHTICIQNLNKYFEYKNTEQDPTLVINQSMVSWPLMLVKKQEPSSKVQDAKTPTKS